MPRPKKEYKILSIKLSSPISDKLEQFCNESGINKTTAVEKILEHYFDEYFKRSKKDRSLF